MIKKILLIVAVVTLFASVAVMLLAKDSNEGKIGNINNYSKNYIYNRQEKLKKGKGCSKIKRCCLLGRK